MLVDTVVVLLVDHNVAYVVKVLVLNVVVVLYTVVVFFDVIVDVL